VQQDGYAPVRGASVLLNDGQMVTGLTLRAGRHGSVTGTVRDDNGDPIVGAGVTAFNRRIIGFRPMLFPKWNGLSDDRGQFRIANLPPGDYLFCACAPAALPPGVGARQLGTDVMTFAPTFHQAGTRVADAVLIALGYSEDRTGVDITMRPVRPARVSGKVTGAEPDVSKTHDISLIHEDDDPAAVGMSDAKPVVFTADGAFEFVGVTPGRYALEVFPVNGKGLRASLPVTVSDRDVTDLIVPLGPGATVRGHVEFSGGTARPNGDTLEKSSINLVPILLTPTQLIGIGTSGSVGYSSNLSREGSLAIENIPPGRYLVTVRVPYSIWQTVESISTADGRVLQPVLDVPPAGHDAAVITLSDAVGGLLETTLTLGEHEPSNEVRVAVFPVDRTFWTEIYRALGRFATNGVNWLGTASFANLPAGEYYVLELAPEDGPMSPERMAEWAKRATTVRLRAGEKATVALRR
jgi:hypothetical protein